MIQNIKQNTKVAQHWAVNQKGQQKRPLGNGEPGGRESSSTRVSQIA